MTAEVLGIDSNGHTTLHTQWRRTGTQDGVPGTLVEGSDHLSYTYAFNQGNIALTLGIDCDLKDGHAICAGATNTWGSWVLDVVSTAVPSGSSSTPTAGAGSSAPTSDPTKTSNSQRTSASVVGVLIGLVLAYQLEVKAEGYREKMWGNQENPNSLTQDQKASRLEISASRAPVLLRQMECRQNIAAPKACPGNLSDRSS
ncbi:hypothetical protein FB451DRAFT_1167884 [Mycena latifolia]|nr:hypothetical protein FB451DRAFT_1167884 [Mycena latifolia]